MPPGSLAEADHPGSHPHRTTEGALWGSIWAHGHLHGSVVLSDDAGQFAVGDHALCWATLPKVPCAMRMEWQGRGMPSGWCTSSIPRLLTDARHAAQRNGCAG